MKFIDSNVFIYAADSKNHEKRAIARKLISSAVLSGGCRINVQVLNEFSSVAYRKLGLTVEEIKAYLKMFRALPVLPVSADATEKALDVMKRYGFSSMIRFCLSPHRRTAVTNSSQKISMTVRFTVE